MFSKNLKLLLTTAITLFIVGLVYTLAFDKNYEKKNNIKTNEIKEERISNEEIDSNKTIDEKKVVETKTESKTDTKKETKTESKTETKKDNNKTESKTNDKKDVKTENKVVTKTEEKKQDDKKEETKETNNSTSTTVVIKKTDTTTTTTTTVTKDGKTTTTTTTETKKEESSTPVIENKENKTTEQANTKTEEKQNNQTQETNVVLENIVSDKIVIPDKYNTGVKGNLTKYNLDMDLGLKIKMSGNAVVINFAFKQNHIPEIVIQNIDFTDYDKVAIYGGGENITDTKIKLIFKNCKFNFVSTPANFDTDITVEFQNCTIQNFGGSNASFNKCFFGGSSHDGMNPHRNVTVKNSYFAGINTYDANNARHYDGVQMFGSNTIDNLLVENLKFYNCRFEVPAINETRNGVPSKSGVNAPIMFALEYDNGNNVTFENIIANGGGYSVYATTKNGVSYKNLTFKNVKLGYGHLFGKLYPMTDTNKANTKFINFGYYDSLYIGSVWKDSKAIHISTTNDTLIERKLTCKTDKDTYNFNIPAHPKLTRENNSTFKFNQMPYDIDNKINDTSAKYIKCYDTTNTDILSNEILIRTQKF